MDNKIWFIEMEVSACLWVGAVIAFTLMLGHAAWMNLKLGLAANKLTARK